MSQDFEEHSTFTPWFRRNLDTPTTVHLIEHAHDDPPLFTWRRASVISSGQLPEIKDNPEKQAFAANVWKYLEANVGTTVRNRGLLLYYWIMAMMDNSMLQHYDSFDFFPQAAVKLQAFSAEDFKRGCSNVNRDTYTMKPSITAADAHPMPQHGCMVVRTETKAKNPKGRHRLYPHPKVLDHVARRTIFRGIFTQSVIWGVQGLRGLFSG